MVSDLCYNLAMFGKERNKQLEGGLQAEKMGTQVVGRRVGRSIGDKLKGLFANERRKNDNEQVENRRAELTRLSLEQGVRILERTGVEGSPISLTEGHEMRRMGARDYFERGLTPQFRAELEGVKYNFSWAINLDGKRDAVISYVEMPDGRTTARGYYRSGSSGLWRYLPDYHKDEALGAVDYYGKGADEEQLTLPAEIQGALGRVVSETWRGATEEDKKVNPAQVEAFFGTARRMSEGKYYTEMREKGAIKDALGSEVSSKPAATFNKTFETGARPEQMGITGSGEVDFVHEKGRFGMSTNIYEGAVGRMYDSKDGRMTYLFLETRDRKACLASVQTKAPITSTGLRREWVKGGDLVTPLYEYASQDSGMGDPSDIKGRYVGMWKNCVSKFPIIKDYKKNRRRV